VDRSYWKTESTSKPREHVTWPAPAQILRQIVTLVAVAVVWGLLFAGYIGLTGFKAPPPAVASSGSATRVVRPTFTATPLPQNTATPTALPTEPAATLPPPTPTLVATVAVVGSTPSQVPAASVTATATSANPTATPLPSATQVATRAPTATPAVAKSTTAPTGSTSTVSFAGDVLPILERRCVKCHGGDKTEEGLSLKSYQDIMSGSNNGPVINPGNVEDSFLISQIVNGKMPKRQPRLLAAEIDTITAWVKAGAPDN
jgi:hypothetical protein